MKTHHQKKSWFVKNKNQIFISILGSIGSAIFIGLLFGFPKFVIEHWGYVKGRFVFATSEPISVNIIRSFVNNQFILTKNPDGTVKDFNVYGANTTFQIHLMVANNYDESVRISSMDIYGITPYTKITSLMPEAVLAPSEHRVFDFPEVPLFKIKDSLIVPALFSGNLRLQMATEFGEKTFSLCCVCFGGIIRPVDDHLFWVGTDSSCLKYELENSEGFYKQSQGFTK
jgi:hypothetical protein